MDLANYKKVWKDQPEEKNKISSLEIYKMTQSRSISIAKWIFMIGLLEFIFWFFINYLTTKNGVLKPYEELNLMTFLNYTNYLQYIVVVLFLLLFYRNFSSVSAVDDTKTLMKKILLVRKTVKWYVYYNLISVVVFSIILNILIFNSPNALSILYNINSSSIDQTQMITIIIIIQVIIIVLMLLILWLFYYLLYGILLKKLNKNYLELTKLSEI
tara:strand:+ start:1804 stop:2445 length:642 start_codon:yes stop_codon:yes gene_type:complete